MNTEIKRTLKDFQYLTVKRVCSRFKSGNNRVLVADEVGLGKTIIAKGVVSEIANEFFSEKEDGKLINKNKVFKVVYICSNQVIARQNIRKLDLDGTWENSNHSDTRLSMQTLKIYKDSKDKNYKNKIQLVPLTPYTSFSLSRSYGIKEERAYIFVILSEIYNKKNLGYLKTNSVSDKSWKDCIEQTKKRVEHQGKIFLNDVKKKIDSYYKERNIELFSDLKEIKDSEKIQKLRKLFASISVKMLNPNLVILDEFQRFKELLELNKDNSFNDEVSMLTSEFFGKEGLKILLLSATPYKLYSTKNEILSGESNHKAEFDSVINFILNNQKKINKFNNAWEEYSNLLENPLNNNNWKSIVSNAEKALYEGVCRTERNSVMTAESFIKESRVELELTPEDIKSYLQMGELITRLGLSERLPVDYTKSCPFLMSYMANYEIKKKIKNAFTDQKTFPPNSSQSELWIKKETIENYYDIPITNGKINALRKIIFDNNSRVENLLWIPPSKPYYKMDNAYSFCNEQSYLENPFSKYIVFSAWEMVPRMISTFLSYEVEKKVHQNLTRTFYSKKYEPKFFDFVDIKKQNRYYLYTFIYPSRTLAKMYNPLDYIGLSLKEVKEKLSIKITKLIADSNFSISRSGKGNSIYYSLLPMYWDNNSHIASNSGTFYNLWKKSLDNYKKDELYIKHINDTGLDKILNLKNEELPSDIVEVLVNMAIAAPATCIYRTLQDNAVLAKISDLANHFCRIFNSTESVGAIRNVYKDSVPTNDDDDEKNTRNTFWKDVLSYSADGCFQAMFDEYFDTMASNANSNASVLNDMMDSIVSVNANYAVDTYDNFINTNKNKDTELRMRTHFAVSFVKGKEDESSANRKEKVRNAFNSPLRPFVLATTSIGQEGLDFHNYCRKIVHWNLPTNAIDMEQREGRVNRFKCLAIRQNIANQNDIKNSKNNSKIWPSLYLNAEKNRPAGKSELYPYWCLGDDEKIKIERITLEYPLSLDEPNYETLMDVLLNYRMTLGQPNQEDLVNFLKDIKIDEDRKKQLCINLSPFDKK